MNRESEKKYKIIITKNYEKYKTIKEYSSIEWAWKKFNKTCNKNNKIIFPKKYISSTKERKVIPVKYHILLLSYIGNDEYNEKTIIGDFGETINLKTSEKGWSIIAINDFYIEETFKVFGINERMNCLTIMRKILNDRPTRIRQVSYVGNKLVIDYFTGLHVVLCKNVQDASRFHEAMKKFAEDNYMKNLIFFGEAKGFSRSYLYDKLSIELKKPLSELYRNTTKS